MEDEEQHVIYFVADCNTRNEIVSYSHSPHPSVFSKTDKVGKEEEKL